MHVNPFALLKSERFLPLFVSQFLSAFNDNAFKLAMLTVVSFSLYSQNPAMSTHYHALGGALFILPFFLFSAIAGQVADKYNKATLIRLIKALEIILMLIGAISLWFQQMPLMLFTLFGLGVHSSFFGPLKLGILPHHLKRQELLCGNALVAASTFIAILFGTLIGTFAIEHIANLKLAIFVISCLLIASSIAGFIGARYIPNTDSADSHLHVDYNVIRATVHVVKNTFNHKKLGLVILAISWFWLFGGMLLAELPNYVKGVLHSSHSVFAFLLCLFTLGFALGAFLVTRLLKGHVATKYVPLAALGMSVFLFDLCFLSPSPVASSDKLTTLVPFLSSFNHWHLSLALFFIGVSGGVFAVPLYTLLQFSCKRKERAQVISANNIFNALFIVLAAGLISVLSAMHLTIPGKLLMIGIANIFVAVYICKLLPHDLLKSIFSFLLRALYKVKVVGLENYYMAGDKVIIIANHSSLLDIILLSAFLPERYTVTANANLMNKWWFKPFLSLVKVCPMDATTPMATKSMIKSIKAGQKFILFPEGRPTETGTIMKVYEEPALVADKSDAMLLPIRIDGAMYSPFSRMKGKTRTRLLPKVTLTILPPRKFDLPQDISSRARRAMLGTHLYEIMTTMMFESSSYRNNLFKAFLDAKKIHGRNKPILEDTKRVVLSYQSVLTKTWVLGQVLKNKTQEKEVVGIYLPTTCAAAVSIFALHAYKRIPAMLNYSAGVKSLIDAIETAQIKRVVTSEQFIKTAKLESVIETVAQQGTEVIYLEQLKFPLPVKLWGLFKSYFSEWFYQKEASDETAMILFTSGSEGSPKGVALSHENLLANCHQMAAKVDFTPRDIVFNALPIFHCFGLTAGTLLPMVFGLRTFLYPSPLHYRIVPELVYETNATIMYGTNTFLSGYAKYAHPYDFHTIRLVFAGAEKLTDEIRYLYAEQFGVRLCEGYGATETAPVISTNTPIQYKAGTTGTFLPCIQHQLKHVEGIKEGGRLFVKGPNIMKGYYFHENPGKLVPIGNDGWYDTGDIVDVDPEGFIKILGRAKRFAKIGGEMVSLTLSETLVNKIWPDNTHAVIAIEDNKKGEQLLLITDHEGAKRDAIVKAFKEKGYSDMLIPKQIKVVDEVPVLTSGKLDYVSINNQYKQGA